MVLGYPSIGANIGITATEGIISGMEGDYYVTRSDTRADSWNLTGPNAVNLGAFRGKQEAEDEAEREEFLARRNTRMRRQYRDEDDGPLA